MGWHLLVWLFRSLVLPSLDLLILQEITHSLMFSRMVWVLPPSQTSHCLDLPKLLFSLVLLRSVPCLQVNTREDLRIFQLVLMDPVELFQEDTHLQLKLRILMNVTENSTLKSKTAVVPCLEFSVLCAIHS